MNKKLLESKMKLYGDTNASIAKYIGISQQTFIAKKNQTKAADFKVGEIVKIKEKYSLSAEEVDAIFFAS